MMNETAKTAAGVRSPYSYVQFDAGSEAKLAAIKGKFEELTALINDTLPVPPTTGNFSQDVLVHAISRSHHLVSTHLEDAYTWVGKWIRDFQIFDGGTATENTKRGNA